ncbi:RNA polymerase sigma factor [uncultured Alistipes sp.]|uniref:RNA polymerase sigma factor n=1 Tax=uncultured Alistipes sp. TaxID=538949 RepID=UPI0025F4E842|nr:RNA polymerase sigma factor [uncultured Alistipes sp.]
MNQTKIDQLGQIIDQYQDQMFRFAFFRTGSLEDSRDIVQDVFLKMYGRIGRNAVIDNVKSYLYRSISNSCSDYMRRKQSTKHVPLNQALQYPEKDDDRELIEEYQRIDALMEELPGEQAEVIRMRTVDSLAFTEIAEILGVPVTTVKSRFKYGIEKLKTKIS